MAVSFDVASTGAGPSPNFNWLHNVANPNGILCVDIGDFVGTNTEAATSITYNGVALTLLGVSAWNTSRVSTWYLLNPATGSNSIVVNCGSTIACVAHSWYPGAGETVNIRGAVGKTGAVSVDGQPFSANITGATTSWLVAHTGNLTDNLTNPGTQTLINNSTSGGFHCGAARKAGSGSSTTLSWTNYTSDNRWAVLAYELYAVSSVVRHELTSVGVGR